MDDAAWRKEKKKLFDELKEEIIAKGCPHCKGKIEYIGHNKFKCIKLCQGENIVFKLSRQWFQKGNPTDSRNWKATCDECGGTMDYYNFKYCCRKCGHILEV